MIKLSLCWSRIARRLRGNIMKITILCIVWEKNISKWTKIILIRGPELTMLGSPDTRLVPWLIMSGHRLLLSGPKLLRWKYGRGPEINMSGPRLIMSLPLLVMSLPRDIYVGAPTYYVGAPYLLFRGSQIIMLGPDLSFGDPDLLCLGTEINMGASTMSRPLLVTSGPQDNHMENLNYYVGAEIIMFGSRFIMLEPLLITSGPQILCHITSIR